LRTRVLFYFDKIITKRRNADHQIAAPDDPPQRAVGALLWTWRAAGRLNQVTARAWRARNTDEIENEAWMMSQAVIS